MISNAARATEERKDSHPPSPPRLRGARQPRPWVVRVKYVKVDEAAFAVQLFRLFDLSGLHREILRPLKKKQIRVICKKDDTQRDMASQRPPETTNSSS